MENYDSLSVAIEIQRERERAKEVMSALQALATAVGNRAAEHRVSLDTATKSEYDYIEGLVDGYEICYNQLMEIINKESN